MTTKFQAVVLLGEQNWTFYKHHIKAIAFGNDAKGILNGTESRPADLTSSSDSAAIAAVQTAQASYDKKTKELYTYISCTQSPNTLMHIDAIPEGDAAGCWKSLLSHFESQSKASIKQMLAKIITLNMSEYPGVTEFTHDLTARLASLKAAIAEQKADVVDMIGCTVLLDGLSEDYAALSALLTLDDKNMVFNDCKKKVLESGERIKYDAQNKALDTSFNSGHALKVGTNTTQFPVDKDGRRYCPGCNKMARHALENCWEVHPHLRTASEARKITTPAAKSVRGNNLSIADMRRLVAEADENRQGSYDAVAW